VQVDDVVAAALELRLNEEPQEVRVAAVAVDDQDLLEPVSRDLLARGVEQVPEQAAGQREGAGLVPRLVDLSVEVVGEGREATSTTSTAAEPRMPRVLVASDVRLELPAA